MKPALQSESLDGDDDESDMFHPVSFDWRAEAAAWEAEQAESGDMAE